MSTRTRLLVPILFVLLSAAGPSSAETPWRWPEEPKNMKVLPKEMTGKKLIPVMTGFTRALGVRCTYCHVGEEGKPLETYDFASDQNPNKDRARDMYRMLGSINEQLKKFPASGETRVNMWCHTCHQGRPRPATLGEELGAAYRKSGVDAAVARYRELRERFYGRGGYDFGERSLNDFGYELLGKKDNDGAVAILRLNTDQYPKSGNAWDSLAEAYLTAGNKALAETSYRKALELDPQNTNAVEKLRALEAKPAP